MKTADQLQANTTPNHKPHESITLKFCPTCGHDNRFLSLGKKHYAGGRICRGVPVEITYMLVE
jgi:hypothetical protein